MPTTSYFSINGELIGEKVGAAARTDYLTDALGGVTATLNQSGAVVNTYRYKPYGGQRALDFVPAQCKDLIQLLRDAELHQIGR
jgi:hypothetical protein